MDESFILCGFMGKSKGNEGGQKKVAEAGSGSKVEEEEAVAFSQLQGHGDSVRICEHEEILFSRFSRLNLAGAPEIRESKGNK
ncbi:hypothetical protein QQP08_002004 [Theobroma cacao]|nr:hypothetical protein QQP08_002004 [Theobroma cacao]